MPRVLVVDNEPPIRHLLTDILRGAGYNVSVARSGFEAIEIAQATRPEVVLLDVAMPGFDGWATLDYLRSAAPDLRVLMMSGTDWSERAVAAGAVAFIEKPYFPAAILQAVAQALGESPEGPRRHAA